MIKYQLIHPVGEAWKSGVKVRTSSAPLEKVLFGVFSPLHRLLPMIQGAGLL